MNFVQLTPGAGGMYCGNCFRDNALVAELRRLGHAPLLLPLYLPLNLDETDESRGQPLFFGGVNVYLDQVLPWYRHAPGWVRRRLDAPGLLRWAGGRAARTRAEEVGELTLSMLRGEAGNQRRELDQLVDWLSAQPRPDVVCLSNALLIGLARRLHERLRIPVLCMLQGEDEFLDAMAPPHRETAWRTLAERARDVDRFVAPSRYFADRMRRRLGLSPEHVRVVPNGIALDGYTDPFPPPTPSSQLPAPSPQPPTPTLGYFARMSAAKGLDLLVEAFVRLRRHGRAGPVRLKVGGSCGPADQSFVQDLRRRIDAEGLGAEVEFHPNLDRPAKLAFLRSLSVFSVPARYSEAFGLYLIEAMAAGVPVVQPRQSAFPEILETSGGGLLCEPDNPDALAAALESLLRDPARARALGDAGRAAAHRHYSAARMAERMIEVVQELRPTAALVPQP